MFLCSEQFTLSLKPRHYPNPYLETLTTSQVGIRSTQSQRYSSMVPASASVFIRLSVFDVSFKQNGFLISVGSDQLRTFCFYYLLISLACLLVFFPSFFFEQQNYFSTQRFHQETISPMSLLPVRQLERVLI